MTASPHDGGVVDKDVIGNSATMDNKDEGLQSNDGREANPQGAEDGNGIGDDPGMAAPDTFEQHHSIEGIVEIKDVTRLKDEGEEKGEERQDITDVYAGKNNVRDGEGNGRDDASDTAEGNEPTDLDAASVLTDDWADRGPDGDFRDHDDDDEAMFPPAWMRDMPMSTTVDAFPTPSQTPYFIQSVPTRASPKKNRSPNAIDQFRGGTSVLDLDMAVLREAANRLNQNHHDADQNDVDSIAETLGKGECLMVSAGGKAFYKSTVSKPPRPPSLRLTPAREDLDKYFRPHSPQVVRINDTDPNLDADANTNNNVFDMGDEALMSSFLRDRSQEHGSPVQSRTASPQRGASRTAPRRPRTAADIVRMYSEAPRGDHTRTHRENLLRKLEQEEALWQQAAKEADRVSVLRQVISTGREG